MACYGERDEEQRTRGEGQRIRTKKVKDIEELQTEAKDRGEGVTAGEMAWKPGVLWRTRGFADANEKPAGDWERKGRWNYLSFGHQVLA